MFHTRTYRRRVRRLVTAAAISLALVATGCSGTGSSDYPSGTIRVVIPFGAGGGTDTDARAVVSAMAAQTDANIVVENVEGGGGALGVIQAMSRPADGRTVALVFPSIHAMGQEVFDADYDLESMEYIGGFRESYNVIAAAAGSGIESLDDLLARGEERGRLVVVSGPKSAFVVTGQQVADTAGVPIESLNYEGVPQAFAGLEAGDGDFWMGGDGAAAGLGDSANLLAYAAPERSPLLPDVPTLGELGIDDVYLDPISAGFVVREGTDPEIVETLREMLQEAMESDEVAEYAEETQASLVYSEPDVFQDSVKQALDVTREYHDLLAAE